MKTAAGVPDEGQERLGVLHGQFQMLRSEAVGQGYGLLQIDGHHGGAETGQGVAGNGFRRSRASCRPTSAETA
jgi:hypothetical protein